MAPPDTPPPVRRTALVYTGLRLLLFAGAFGVCLVAGLDTPIGLVVALLVSSAGSLFLLRRQREELTTGLLARNQAKADAKERRRRALDEG